MKPKLLILPLSALLTSVAVHSALAQEKAARAFTAAELAERAIERRAVEAVNWGMSAVNYDLMLQEMLDKTSGKVNQVVLLVASPRLAQSDADAQSGCDLLHGVLQHQGGSDRRRGAARGWRRLAQRQLR
jgi:hypothetical protein